VSAGIASNYAEDASLAEPPGQDDPPELEAPELNGS